MIYILTMALIGLCLALAIGAGIHELRRLNSELALEKTRQKTSLALLKAKEEGIATQRILVARTLETTMNRLLDSADEQLSVYNSDSMQFSSLSQATRLVRSVQRQLNDLSNPVPKRELSIHGLEYYLEKLVGRMNSPQLSISFTSNLGGLRFSRYQEQYIFQACSELIQNTLKHSDASHCQVGLSIVNGELYLKVKDNGINNLGIGPPTPGFGLTRLKQKSEKFGGDFKFKLTNHGAETQLSIPIVRSAVLSIA